jgi:hypothetical protein
MLVQELEWIIALLQLNDAATLCSNAGLGQGQSKDQDPIQDHHCEAQDGPV